MKLHLATTDFALNESAPIQLALGRFMGWPSPVLKYKYIFFQIKYAEAVLSNSTRKLLWFEITKMLTAVQEKNLLYHLVYFLAHFYSL